MPAILKRAEDFNAVATPTFVTDLTPIYSGRTPWLGVWRVRRGFKVVVRQ